MQQFTQEELRNIGVLIQKATISGAEAITVTMLLQKIGQLLTPDTKPEIKNETGTKGEKNTKTPN